MEPNITDPSQTAKSPVSAASHYNHKKIIIVIFMFIILLGGVVVFIFYSQSRKQNTAIPEANPSVENTSLLTPTITGSLNNIMTQNYEKYFFTESEYAPEDPNRPTIVKHNDRINLYIYERQGEFSFRIPIPAGWKISDRGMIEGEFDAMGLIGGKYYQLSVRRPRGGVKTVEEALKYEEEESSIRYVPPQRSLTKVMSEDSYQWKNIEFNKNIYNFDEHYPVQGDILCIMENFEDGVQNNYMCSPVIDLISYDGPLPQSLDDFWEEMKPLLKL